MQTLETVQARAESESRRAWEFVTEQAHENARAIAENIDEPEILLEQIIQALHNPGTSASCFKAVPELIGAEVRKYANLQAEAAHDHIMRTPS